MGTWYYAFLIGLAGSWHCAIMCGPIYQQIHSRGTATTRMGLYAFGRIFMYGILGFAVAGIGSIWLFPAWWQAYYVIAGILIALIQPNPWMGAMSMVSFGMATLPALRFSVWGINWLGNGKPWLKWLGWIVVSILLFRGAYGIGVGHSAYLQHAKITPIICHPFSENLSP